MTVDNFIPIKWSSTLLDRLEKDLIWKEVCNTDYDGEIANEGDTVRVNSVGPVTITAYTKNTWNMTPQVLTGAGQSMTITQCDSFYFGMDDVDKAQIKGGVMEQAMNEASYGLRDSMDQFLAAKHASSISSTNTMLNGGVASSTTNAIQVGTGLGNTSMYNLLVDMATLMNVRNVPGGGRWVVIDPYGLAALLKDPQFTGFATSGAFEIIRKGSSAGGKLGGAIGSMLTLITGLEIYISNNVPSTGTPTVYTIMAGYKGVCSYAMQIPEGQPEAFRSHGGFADLVRGKVLYGAHVFRPEALMAAYVTYI